jgi:hypothetical protein
MASQGDSSIGAREAEALAEIDATDIAPGLARACTAAFLLATLVVPAAQIGRELAGGAGPLTSIRTLPAEAMATYRDARPSHVGVAAAIVTANRHVQRRIDGFDDEIEDDTWISGWLRGPVQLALSGVLGAGNQQAYLGRGGWLFYGPDVRYVVGPGFLKPRQLSARIAAARSWEAPPQPDPGAAILDFKRQLEARGIALVVMPTPGKATIHPERLSNRYSGHESPPHNRSYASFVRDLEGHGVVVFDPSAVITGLRTVETPAFLATDSHWRPEVVEAVASRLVEVLVARTGLTRAASPYRFHRTSVANIGDLAALLGLPAGSRLNSPESVTVTRVLHEAGAPWRTVSGGDVLLLGDSFSNIYSQSSMGWGTSAGLAEHLSAALGRPVDRIVQNDQGAHATRDLLARQLAERPDRLAPVRVIVYQFAARELAGGDWRKVDLGK